MRKSPEMKLGQRVPQPVYFERNDPAEQVNDDIVSWLRAQATVMQTGFLLAHALDGVIWGRIKAGALITGDVLRPDVVPLLRHETLEQARLFNTTEEHYVWRADETWYSCLTRDVQTAESGDLTRAFDEQHVLWGTYAAWHKDDFTLVEDGMQGMRHLLPLKLSDHFPKTLGQGARKTDRRACLRVRHYLGDATPSGVQRIIRSRLVNVEEVQYEYTT